MLLLRGTVFVIIWVLWSRKRGRRKKERGPSVSVYVVPPLPLSGARVVYCHCRQLEPDPTDESHNHQLQREFPVPSDPYLRVQLYFYSFWRTSYSRRSFLLLRVALWPGHENSNAPVDAV